MELREYSAIIWRWLWLIMLGMVLAGGTAFFVSRNMTPVYQASSTLLINQAQSPNTASYQDIITSERIAKTYAELMIQPPILEKVAAEIGLDPEDLVEDIQVSPVRDTQLIRIDIEDESPWIAAQVANTLPQVFIAENEKNQSARFASSKANLSAQLEALRRDVEKTKAAVEAIGEPDTVAEETELNRLQSQLAQYQNSYSALLQSYENVRISEAQSIDTITVVAPAKIPKAPIRPRTKLNTLLAGVVGAMLATGVAFLIEYLDDTIKSPDDLRDILGLAWLGSIARIPGQNFAERLITASDPRHPISEAYRTLRTNLQFSTVDTGLKSIVVTSAAPTEGKTTTAANPSTGSGHRLAVVMAQAGLSVILVDADLRRPRLHDIFGLSGGGGVTDVMLHGNPSPMEYVRETQTPNLRILTSGQLPPNPAELLGSERMRELIDRLGDEADIVIFDSPPILAVTDAAVLGRQVDGVLLVVDAGVTRYDAAMRSVEALRKVNANILGGTLNRLSRRSRGYSYYDYYYAAESEKQSSRRRSRRKNGILAGVWQRLRG